MFSTTAPRSTFIRIVATIAVLPVLLSVALAGPAAASERAPRPAARDGAAHLSVKSVLRCAPTKAAARRRGAHCRPPKGRPAVQPRINITTWTWTPQYHQCTYVQQASWGQWFACSFFQLQSGVGSGDGAVTGITWFYIDAYGRSVPYYQVFPGYIGPAVNA